MTIAEKVEKGFNDFKYDVGKFLDDFTDYLKKKDQDLMQKANGYKLEIDKYQGEVDRCILLVWQFSDPVVALEFLTWGSFYRSLNKKVHCYPQPLRLLLILLLSWIDQRHTHSFILHWFLCSMY